MRATINGKLYDSKKAEEICMEAHPDMDITLYQTKDGKFFLLTADIFLDGVKLRPSQCLDDLAPELSRWGPEDQPGTALSKLSRTYGEESADAIRYRRRIARVRRVKKIVPMTDREALVWCVKTQMPDCFRAYVLDSI